MKDPMIPALTGAILVFAGMAHAADKPTDSGKPDTGQQCFRSESYQGFRDIDEHAFNIRVNGHDVYRIEVEGGCPTLTSPDAMLITHVRGSDLICGPLDWDLRVRESGPGGMATGCIVKSQRKLTPAEVAAIPPKQKP